MSAATASAVIAATSAVITASTWLLDRADRKRTARDTARQKAIDAQQEQAKQVAAWLPPKHPESLLVSNTSSMPIYNFRARIRIRALGNLPENIDPVGWIHELSPLVPPTSAGSPFSIPFSISKGQQYPTVIEELEWWEFTDASGVAWRFGISTLQLVPVGGRALQPFTKKKRFRTQIKGYFLSFHSKIHRN